MIDRDNPCRSAHESAKLCKLWALRLRGCYVRSLEETRHTRSYRRRGRSVQRLTGGTSLTAVLVESRRVDSKPRQRIVSYLGTIRESGLPHYYHRVDFWRSVQTHLDRLALAPEARERIESVLEQRVERPTLEAEQATKAELARLTASLQGSLRQ